MNGQLKRTISTILIVSGWLVSSSGFANYETENSEDLVTSAEVRFRPLGDAERELFEKVARGEIADLRKLKDRVLRAKCIAWLFERGRKEQITRHGVRIKGARIVGQLDLDNVDVSFPFFCDECEFLDAFQARDAHIGALHLTNVQLQHGLTAKGLHTLNDIRLLYVTAFDQVTLDGAIVGGNLDGAGSRFHRGENENVDALTCRLAKIAGDIDLRESSVLGRVDLRSTTIAGDLYCARGKFVNPRALLKKNQDDETAVAVHLEYAQIGGTANLGNFPFQDDRVLDDVSECCCLRMLPGYNEGQGFHAYGEVWLLGATMKQLNCIGGRFENPNGDALTADHAHVFGSVLLRYGFHATGRVRLRGAKIDGNLSCVGGRFDHGENDVPAIDLRNAEIDGTLLMKPSRSDPFAATGEIDLRYAVVGILDDSYEEESYDKNTLPYEMRLDGFVYDQITPINGRLDWLESHTYGRSFRPHSYEQLAKVLRNSGYMDDAKAIAIAKEKKAASPQWLATGWLVGYGVYPGRAFWPALVFIVIGWYLFKTEMRVMVPTDRKDAYPNGDGVLSDHYPKLIPLIYSIDTFVPIIDLRQASYWVPSINRGIPARRLFNITSGRFLQSYLWLHTAAGWIMTTFVIASLTGLVKS